MIPVWAHCIREPELYGAICTFVAERVWGRANDFGPGSAMGVELNGVPVAGVVFHNYDPYAGIIEVSGASDNKRWATRRVLGEIYGYVFDQLSCQAVLQRNDPADEALCRNLTAIGFKRYDIPRLRGRDKADAIFVMAEEDWRSSRFNRSGARPIGD